MISDLVEVVLFPLFLQHTNLVEYVCGLKIIFRLYHYPVHENRDAISADLQIKNRLAYHGAHGGTRMNHTTHEDTQTAGALMMSGTKSHHPGEKTDQNLITASWNEITTRALLLYRSQYIIHPSLPPPPTNGIKPQKCPSESGLDCWFVGGKEDRGRPTA